ncbi:UNVERIFIED_CONTAM: hypothetical protein FKN15_038508 [Acipenser sinensis]
MNWKLQQGWRAPPIPRTAWRGTQQQQQRDQEFEQGWKLTLAHCTQSWGAQGIVTWLAARKPGALQKGISPLNRPTFTQMVQTHLPTVPSQPPMTQRTRQWRTSTTDGGILTVSIDNPTARTVPPDPPRPRILRPPMPPAPLKLEDLEEKKVPKGVPLEFDINSVGKQTALTLNERFKILKDQRTAVAQTKGSRFVTVGALCQCRGSEGVESELCSEQLPVCQCRGSEGVESELCSEQLPVCQCRGSEGVESELCSEQLPVCQCRGSEGVESELCSEQLPVCQCRGSEGVESELCSVLL